MFKSPDFIIPPISLPVILGYSFGENKLSVKVAFVDLSIHMNYTLLGVTLFAKSK